MLVKRAPDIKSSEITDEKLYLNRRQFIQAAGTIGAGLGMASLALENEVAAQTPLANVRKGPFGTTKKMNSFHDITHYNNFYEFGIDKTDPAQNGHRLKTKPWSVKVEGLCNKPATYDLDELIKGFPLEER